MIAISVRPTATAVPFNVCTGSVPRSVRYVPVKYRRHWKNGPPAHAVANGYHKNKDHNRYYEHDSYKSGSKSNGQGNSKNHGKGNKH